MVIAGRLFNDIADRNPWWGGAGLVGTDLHLQRLSQARFRRRPALLDTLDPTAPNVYVIRGPRQVGKTTLLKQFVERLITQDRWDPRLVVYYPLDLLSRPAHIVEFVKRVKAAYPPGAGKRWCFLLDEVTAVPEWQRGVKSLRDNTDAAHDCFVLTGSSSVDLRRGAERLPGRRGPGSRLDQVLLPLTFPEFLRATRPALAPQTELTLEELMDSGSNAALHEASFRLDNLESALTLYADIGGFPAAVGDFLANGQVSGGTLEMVWNILAEDLSRAGRRADALPLLSRLVASLSSSVDWASLANDLGVARATAENLATRAADLYLCLILYFREQDGAIAPRKGKKLYAIDPLVLRLPPFLQGTPPAPLAAVIENLVATALLRACERDLTEAFKLPPSLSFWRSSTGKEIDFIAGTRPQHLAVEVKYQNRVGSQDALVIRNAFGRGLIVSRQDLVLDSPVRVIPAAIFLALLAH